MKNKILPTVGIDRLLTQHQVEDITGLSDSTMESWRAKKKGIPFVKVGTRKVMYRESDVTAYIKSLTDGEQPPASRPEQQKEQA